ncbi:complement component C1q receptor [Brachionichthys hirsutus]|uniref:complement component C1q receptor n=1 Tax=Brachionichthys hirsutus TaxID=412623 RepID=UPI003604FE5A
MVLILLLLLVNSVEGLSGTEHETLCVSGVCFTLHMDRTGFESARQSCVHNGGYLMTARGREEEDLLRLLLSQIQRPRQDRVLKFWIGLKLHRGNCVSADKTLRGFKWVSGEEESGYSNWDKEPVITCIEERCVRVHYTSSGESNLKWHAGSCRSPSFYACKFYFQGMCKPLTLLGPGQMTYTLPFSEKPQKSAMKSYPLGTYAEIACADQQSHYSVCAWMDGVYRWNAPGPFCKTGRQNCSINNGGCEQICHQEADEARCVCREGHNLGEDGLSCRMRDLCGVDACEHQCVTGDSGYSCKCPNGLKLHANQRNCSDVDECQSQSCGRHLCVNTYGSYTCVCKDGYRMVSGECGDINECLQSACEHGCVNSIGSFSCYCNQGFALVGGRSCIDVNECVSGPCQFECTNTEGSFLCTCPRAFLTENHGRTCTPDATGMSAAMSESPADEDARENFTESLSRTTVEVQHQPPHTDTSLPDPVNTTHGDRRSNMTSLTSVPKAVNSRVLICVLGSVIPLLLLIAATLAVAIFRCSRKKEEKKKAATDGYCWVSSGLDPRLEKLYESILTDDL